MHDGRQRSQRALFGGLKCFTDVESGTFDHDTLVINHPRCLQDLMCKAAQPNQGENMQTVRDECMACVWVAKTFPLFKEICKPDNVDHDCQAIVANYGAPYRPDADLAGQQDCARTSGQAAGRSGVPFQRQAHGSPSYRDGPILTPGRGCSSPSPWSNALMIGQDNYMPVHVPVPVHGQGLVFSVRVQKSAAPQQARDTGSPVFSSTENQGRRRIRANHPIFTRIKYTHTCVHI